MRISFRRPAPRPASRVLWGASTAALCLVLGFSANLNSAARGDAPASAAPPVDPAQAEFFEKNVRPVLAANCYACHGKDTQQGGLRADSRAALLKGGDSGTALVPGDPDKSLLVTSVQHVGKLKMPQGGKLKDDEIAALAAWVKMGAPWPGGGAAVPATAGWQITDAQRKFWSFQPVKKPALPKVKDAAWAAGSSLDRFILARLEARGLAPSAPADRRTLIRRATFDLHGLPPTPAEVEAFVSDKTPTAWAKGVDRLLSSPRYGEHWGRHWLDVARYADTKGYVFEEDRRYPNAYTYRDWVVRAFNEDLPYDQFITQQLAADRLPLGDNKRPLAALGFLTVGRRFLNNPHDIADDRIDVTMRGFQGMTVSCARCHNHKFDPIPTADYYSLYGVFASSNEPGMPPIISPKEVAAPYEAWRARVGQLTTDEQNLVMEQIAGLRERQKKGEVLPDPVKEVLQQFREGQRPRPDALAKIEPAFAAGVSERLSGLRATLAELKKTPPPTPEFAMTLEDAPTPHNPHIFKRGNPNTPGDEVPRRFLEILSPAKQRAAWTNGSGRLDLARAIASKSNPLTSRVMVNRIWQHHFGFGLVRTASDFGKQGERPTQPELLDWLASSFMENGWSIKKVHRLILLSNTYRQSSDFDPARFAKDPENRLVWRMNRRRLEYESLRDSLLFASGKLDTSKVGGPSIELWSAPFPARRTIYGAIDRQNLPGILRTFDFATPDATSPGRFFTTVPQQALFLLNSPFATEQARALAARPEVTAKPDPAARVRALYRVLYNRAPDKDELALGLRYVTSALPAGSPSGSAADASAAWRYGWGAWDEKTGRVTAFTPLKVFKENRWQAGDALPDPAAGWVLVSASGGHPGRDAAHAAIRRWISPITGTVSVAGTLIHPGAVGDGVEGRLVSSRAGLLGTWTAQNGRAETNVNQITVKKGDTLDFVVTCRADENTDGFTWAPKIAVAAGAKTLAWNAEADFAGPKPPVLAQAAPLNAWERYAQALLMTNEFTFVD